MRHLLLVILIVVSLPTTAQIKKGDVIATAQLNGQLIQTLITDAKLPRYNFEASGSWGYFIRDGLSLGFSAEGVWNGNKTKLDDYPIFKNESKSFSGALTPFARKYWNLPSVLLYAGGGVGISYSRDSRLQHIPDQTSGDGLSQTLTIYPQAQLGVIYPFTKRLGLELSAKSNLFPLSFNIAQLGLVVLTGPEVYAEDASKDSGPMKGRWLLAGSFNHSVGKGHSTTDGEKDAYRTPSTYFELTPALFIRDRLLLGLGIFAGLSDGVLTLPDQAGYTSTNGKKPFSLGLRPSIKKYVYFKKITPYIEGYASYNRIMGADAPATNSYNAGGNFGLAYLSGKSWIIEARLLGLSGGYSAFGDMRADIATVLGVERFNLKLDAGFKPNFTISYVFR